MLSSEVIMSKSDRVLAAFNSGEELTGKQIASRFSVGNPRALVSSLRMNGYPVRLLLLATRPWHLTRSGDALRK